MKKVLMLCAIMLTNSVMFAETLNIEQARLLALANSRSLKRYEMAIRSSVLDEKNQLYSMLPNVSADYSSSMSYLRNWNFLNPLDTFNAGVRLSVTQIIFQGGKSFIQKAISAIATESVRQDALSEYFNVLDSADNAYYAVLEASAALEAEEAALEVANLALSIAEIRQQSGMISAGDYLKALADRETQENSRNQARRNLALNMSKLKTLLGFDESDKNIELEQVDFTFYESTLLSLSLVSENQEDVLFDKLWNIFVSANPSLAKAVLNKQRAEHNFTLSKRDYVPTVSASVFSTDLNYSAQDGFGSSGSGGVFIAGNIPLDFWVLKNKIEKNKIALDSSFLDYENTEASLKTELQTSLLNIFSQAGSVLSSKRSLEYTEKHFEFVLERYRLSQASVSELSDASSLLISSRNSHIRARYGFLQSLSRLRSLCALEDEEEFMNIFQQD